MTKLLDQNQLFSEFVSFFKEKCSPVEWITRSLPIVDNQGNQIGALAPVTSRHLLDNSVISLFSNWRDEHQYAYPTRFEITDEGTARWLEAAVISNPNRILFLILNQALMPVGHIGLLKKSGDDFSVEVDNVLRGEKSDTPGMMTASMGALETWAEKELSIDKIDLRVLKSNKHAINFYEKLGYLPVSSESLVWETTASSQTLVPGKPSEEELVTMEKTLGQQQPVPEMILTAGPLIGPQERSFAFSAAAYGWNNQHSDFLNKFEQQFAEYVGAKYAMATSSCTGALHLSLLTAGIGPGDEVIVPEISWVATASAVMYTGARPVFADVDPQSWTINCESVEKLITPKTKAIVPVHLYGFPANMHGVLDLANKYGLRVIEDAAPAIGATIGEKSVGTFGDLGCYSFQGAKMLVTGEGGMLVTDNPELAAKAKKLQEHGRKPGTFWIEELGYKYKMSNIQASLGFAQLLRSDNQIHRKRRIKNWYSANLQDISGLRFQEELEGTKSIDWMTSIVYEGWNQTDRDEFTDFLKINGVDTRPVFPPMSQFPIWGYKSTAKSIAEFVGGAAVNLPSGVNLSKNSIDKVSELIRKYLGA